MQKTKKSKKQTYNPWNKTLDWSDTDLTNIMFSEIKIDTSMTSPLENQKSHSPSNRWGHQFISWQNKLYVLGGETRSESFCSKPLSKLPTPIYELHQQPNGDYVWERIATKGDGPRLISSFYPLVLSSYVYTIGGSVDKEVTNCVFKLNLLTFDWERCSFDIGKPRESHIGMRLDEYTVLLHGGSSGTSMDMDEQPLPMNEYLMTIVNIELGTTKIVQDNQVFGVFPGERECHSGTWVNGNYFVFGGERIDVDLEDTHKIEGELAKVKSKRLTLNELYEAKKEGNENDNRESGTKDDNDSKSSTSTKNARVLRSQRPATQTFCTYLNDLYFMNVTRFVDNSVRLNWTEVNYKGNLPLAANFCMFSLENSSLLIVGGIGYAPGIEIEEETPSDDLNSIYCYNIGENLGFEVICAGTLSAINTAAYIQIENSMIIYSADSDSYIKQRNEMIFLKFTHRENQSILHYNQRNKNDMCSVCRDDLKASKKIINGMLKNDRKGIESRVLEDKKYNRVEVSFKQSSLIQQSVLEDFSKLLLIDKSDSVGAVLLGEAIDLLVNQYQMTNAKFEVKGNALLFSGKIDLPISQFLGELEDEIVTSPIYKMTLFIKELKGCSNLFFKCKDGYYLMLLPYPTLSGTSWVKNERVMFVYNKDNNIPPQYGDQEGNSDFLFEFRFDQYSHDTNYCLRKLSASYGAIYLPIPHDSVEESIQNHLYWELGTFFRFFFRCMDKKEFTLEISKEKINFSTLRTMLKKSTYEVLEDEALVSHRFFRFKLNSRDIPRNIFEYFRGNETMFSYFDDHLIQCIQAPSSDGEATLMISAGIGFDP